MWCAGPILAAHLLPIVPGGNVKSGFLALLWPSYGLLPVPAAGGLEVVLGWVSTSILA
jgi:hypothetical protein